MSRFDFNIYFNILQSCKLSVTLLFIICREISDKKELYKRLRIRPEEEKIKPCKKIDVLMIINFEAIPHGFNFFRCFITYGYLILTNAILLVKFQLRDAAILIIVEHFLIKAIGEFTFIFYQRKYE